MIRPLKRKGRIRERRGTTKSFDAIPVSAQERFKILKEEVKKLTPTVDKVYVFGSFHWGWYDEHSDYDLVIPMQEVTFGKEEFTDYIKEKHGFLADIQMKRRDWLEENNFIEIP